MIETIDIGVGSLAFERSGSGDPLLLIPGFASGMWSWHRLTGLLAERFEVIAFDPRGVARSRIAPCAEVTIDLIAEDVVSLLGSLGIESAHVLGISFGGFVAQELALGYPERVNRLVLASTSFGGTGHVTPSSDVLAAFAPSEVSDPEERRRQFLTMAFSPEFVENEQDVVSEFCEQRLENVVPDEVYRQQLASALAFDTSERVGKILARTLVLSGDRDTVVPVENSRNLARAMQFAELRIVPGGSHMLFVERPDIFNEAVTEFLLAR